MNRRSILAFGALTVTALTTGCSDPDHRESPGQSQAGIIGGTADTRHHYTVGVGDNQGAWCSGTLISAQTVLTAAHCALGITHVFFGPELVSYAATDVEAIHPDWSEDDFESTDLAMVRLAAPVTLQPAPMLRATLDNGPEFVGPQWTWSGYGINDANNQSGFGTRRETSIAITAVGPISSGPLGGLPATVIFYEVMGTSPCFGDSGGPAYFIDQAPSGQGTESVAGVASSVGDDFCSTFGIHMRVDQPTIDSWLQPLTDQFEPAAPCRTDGFCNESCNVGGEVLDPDCQSAHCGSDGLCALACVAPADPDCANYVVDFCEEDGICAPSCPQPDMDCNGMTTTVATTTTTIATSTTITSTIVSTVATTSSGSSMSTSGGGGAPGTGGGPPRAPTDGAADSDAQLYGRSCAYERTDPSDSIPAWLMLGAVFLLRRRHMS